MIPAIHKAGATISSAISLRDATYILKSGLGLFTQKTSPGELQKDKRYKEFVQQNEVAKWNVEQSSLKRNNRLYAVSTEEGVLLFSGSEKGIKARGSYLQYLADGFFKLNKVPETMKLYEISIPTQEMTHLADNCIDRFSKSDLKEGSRQLRHSEVSFAAEKFSDHSILEGAVCVDKFDLRPDYNNFDRLTGEFQLGISPRNYDIASLLYISGNGYASHLATDYFHPFSYQYEFGELAEKLADSMKAREEAPLSAHDFGYGALQKEAKEMAKDILQSEFHIHNGEFHLGAKRAAILKEETPKPELMIPKVKRPPRVKQEQGKRNTTGEQALKGNTTRKQAIHVPSVSVTKEKKQLII